MRPTRVLTLASAALVICLPLAAKPAKKAAAPATRCSFEHYPVAVGNVNEYKITSRQLDAGGKVIEENAMTYAEEIVAVEADGYRTNNVSEGNASEGNWLCSAEGIALKYDEYPETTITATGVSIPATMEIGQSWAQTFSMEGPGVSQTTKTTNRVVKREMVSVPAGSFEAWRVEFESETVAAGSEKPTVIRGTQWFVTSVGMVKASSVIPMEMDRVRSVESITELVKQTTTSAP